MATEFKHYSLRYEPSQVKVQWLLNEDQVSQHKMRQLFPHHNKGSFDALVLLMKHKRTDLVKKLLHLHPNMRRPELMKKIIETGFQNQQIIESIPISQKVAYEYLPMAVENNAVNAIKFLAKETPMKNNFSLFLKDYLMKYLNEDIFETDIFDALVDDIPPAGTFLSTICALCFLIKDPQKRCHCLRKLVEKHSNIMRHILYLDNFPLSQTVLRLTFSGEKTVDSAEKINRVLDGIHCLKKLDFHIDYKAMLRTELWGSRTPAMIRYLLTHVDDSEDIHRYVEYAINYHDDKFLRQLYEKFEENIVTPKVVRWTRVFYACWAYPIMLEYIRTRTKQLEIVTQEIEYMNKARKKKTGEYNSQKLKGCLEMLLQIQKQLINEKQTIQGISTLRKVTAKRTTGSIRQHPAKSVIQNRFSDLDELNKAYQSKKSLKDPMTAALKLVQKTNPRNVFVSGSKRKAQQQPSLSSKRMKPSQMKSLLQTRDFISGISGMNQDVHKKFLQFFKKQQQQNKQQ